MISRFSVGDAVRVREAYPPGHVRTPFFVRGKPGVVESVVGAFRKPEDLAYGRLDGQTAALYRVRFRQVDLWNPYDGPAGDAAIVDLYEHWLEPEASR